MTHLEHLSGLGPRSFFRLAQDGSARNFGRGSLPRL